MSMNPYSIIRPSGEIIATTFIDDSIAILPRDDGYLSVSGHSDSATQYYDMTNTMPALMDRPALNSSLDKSTVIADGIDLATITCPQSPVDVTITGPASSQFTDADGMIGLTFDFPGTYIVTVEAWPALKEEYTIVAA